MTGLESSCDLKAQRHKVNKRKFTHADEFPRNQALVMSDLLNCPRPSSRYSRKIPLAPEFTDVAWFLGQEGFFFPPKEITGVLSTSMKNSRWAPWGGSFQVDDFTPDRGCSVYLSASPLMQRKPAGQSRVLTSRRVLGKRGAEGQAPSWRT